MVAAPNGAHARVAAWIVAVTGYAHKEIDPVLICYCYLAMDSSPFYWNVFLIKNKVSKSGEPAPTEGGWL